MSASLVSSATADLVVGQEWLIRVKASELPGLVVFLPDGEQFTPPVVFEAESGYDVYPDAIYVATVPLPFPGRYMAAVISGSTVLVTAQAFAAQTAVSNIPDFAALNDYLGGDEAHSWTEGQLQEAIEIEAAAQRRVCRTPAVYPNDLRAALLRRAARFLDMKRRQTAGDDGGDFEVPSTVAIGRDQEIRRYEAPWRKVVTA